MKHFFPAIIIASILAFSCSKDDDEGDNSQTDENEIVGSWRATEFRDTDPNSSNVNLGADILAKLTAEDCYILTFVFNEDLTLTAVSSVNYLQVNATPTGLDVPCPTQEDTESSTYVYDGSILSIVDSDGEIVLVKVSISGNTMSADAADLDIPNFDGDGELIFEKI